MQVKRPLTKCKSSRIVEQRGRHVLDDRRRQLRDQADLHQLAARVLLLDGLRGAN